jgi:hypothetical protein
MIKAALIQQALAEYVYIYGGYKQVIGHFKRRQRLDKNNQNIEYYLRLDSSTFPIGQLDKF